MDRLQLPRICALTALLAGCDRPEDAESDRPAMREAALEARCGDGIPQAPEACDLGVGNEAAATCTPACTLPRCGDGVSSPGEACDDGNLAAGDGCSPSCTLEHSPRWWTTVDAGGDDTLLDLAATTDGWVAVGRRADGWADSTPIVVSVDRAGALRWIDEPTQQTGWAAAQAVITEGDEAIVVGGRAMQPGVVRPWIWRHAADGTHRFATPLLLDEGEATAILRTDDAHALVAGWRDPVDGPSRSFVVEVAIADGTTDTAQDLVPDATGRRFVEDLALRPGGGFVAAGRLEGAAGSRIWLAAFAADRSLLWEHIGTSDEDWPEDTADALAVDDQGRVYLVGTVLAGIGDDPWSASGALWDYDIWVGAFGADGSPSWSKIVAGPDGLWDYGGDVALDADGSIVVAGTLQTRPLLVPAPWDRDAFVARYAADGTELGSITYDGALHGEDGSNALLVHDDGSIVLAGESADLFEGPNAWIASLHRDRLFAPDLDPVAPDPGPDEPPPGRAADDGQRRATLYLDFDGGILGPGDIGPLGAAPCLSATIEMPGYMGSRQSAETIVEYVRGALSPYAVDVVWEERPPPHLPYTTVMIGGRAEQLGLPAAAAGYSCRVDCGDPWSRDLAFAFERDSEWVVAANVLHEAAHTWGLDHVVGEADLMVPFGAPPGATWTDACLPVSDATSSPRCMEEHARFCPDGEQNGHRELLARLGPATPDAGPPRALIAAPAPGSSHVGGEPIRVVLDVTDDDGDPGWRVVVPGLEYTLVAYRGETELDLALPAGEHTVRLESIDHAGNESLDELTIGVESEPAKDPDDPPAPPGDAPTPAAMDPPADAGVDEGGCRIGRRPPDAAAFALLLLAIVLGRRWRRPHDARRV